SPRFHYVSAGRCLSRKRQGTFSARLSGQTTTLRREGEMCPANFSGGQSVRKIQILLHAGRMAQPAVPSNQPECNSPVILWPTGARRLRRFSVRLIRIKIRSTSRQGQGPCYTVGPS